MDQVMNTLLTTAGTVLCAMITALGALAIVYITKLRQKAQAEIDKIDNESTQTYLSNVLDTVYNNLSASIDRIEVTLVKELKATTEDGKLTKEDQDRVAKAAMELCQQITGNEMMDALGDIVGDTEAYLLTLIDSMVLQKKVDGADLNAVQAINAQANALNG